MHLAFNFITLFSLGHDLEERVFPYFFGDKLGKLYYILLFTGGIYAASITEYLRQRNNPAYSSLGASGALTSIMFCWIMLIPKENLNLFIISMPGWVFGILVLVISYALIVRKKKTDYTDNISHESHFWGAMFGILFILIVKPDAVTHFFKQFFP
jgi:membrane associated rhomboid family serine protease